MLKVCSFDKVKQDLSVFSMWKWEEGVKQFIKEALICAFMKLHSHINL